MKSSCVKKTAMTGRCPFCGGIMLGDGFSEVSHCEFADSDIVLETPPDSDPIFCELGGKKS